MPDISKRHVLKEKEVKQLLLGLSRKAAIDFQQLFGLEPRIELAETPVAEIFLVDGKPLLAKAEDTLFPTLAFSEAFPSLAKIVVDMGAVPHICNGADVMAPGVVLIHGSFRKDDFVLVVDERYNKPLAIGLASQDSEDAKRLKKGKVVKNIHHVGDKLWNLIKGL